MQSYVYILTNKRNGTLYIGSTKNLLGRVWIHKEQLIEGFSKRYKTDKLIYYEIHENINSAYYRERQLKKWKRKWKLRIIEEFNPNWDDLYHEI